MDYQIIDNFLDEPYYNHLKTLLNTVGAYPWYYKPHQCVSDSSFFYHLLFTDFKSNSTYYEEFLGVIDKLNPKAVINVRTNLCLNRGDLFVSEKHRDGYTEDLSHKISILYFGTNNGKTVLCEDGEEIEIDTVDNRLITFPATIQHYVKGQTDTDTRIVLNINHY